MNDSIPEFEPDPALPADWKSKESISDSWAEVIWHCQKKKDYKKRYKLGDTKVASFGSEGLTLMRLVGFDCDELANGSGYCHTAWVPEHCLNTLVQWNLTDTNTGGYAASNIKSKVDPLINKLSPVLQNGILSVKKTCKTKSGSDQVITSKIWIPSSREMGYTGEERENSGPVYTNPPLYPKKTGSTPNGASTASWLRSTAVNATHYSMRVKGGSVYHYNNDISDFRGVLAGFCL